MPQDFLLKVLPILGLFTLATSNARAGLSSGNTDLGAIWFIGDSITQSNADGDSNGSPRKSLYDRLTAGGYTFTYTGSSNTNTDGFNSTTQPNYIWHSGYSGSMISNAISGRVDMTASLSSHWTTGRLATVKPNLILIMLGTNDVDLRASTGLSTTQIAANLQTYVNNIYALGSVGTPTVLISTIAPNNTQAGDNAAVISFNAQLPAVIANLQAAGRDVHLVDSYSALNNNYATAMMPDNLHPNSVGNGIIADTWYSKISTLTAVPEPSTYGLMGAGALALAAIARRRRRV